MLGGVSPSGRPRLEPVSLGVPPVAVSLVGAAGRCKLPWASACAFLALLRAAPHLLRRMVATAFGGAPTAELPPEVGLGVGEASCGKPSPADGRMDAPSLEHSIFRSGEVPIQELSPENLDVEAPEAEHSWNGFFISLFGSILFPRVYRKWWSTLAEPVAGVRLNTMGGRPVSHRHR